MTALAVMAFLSAGHVPGEGRYGETVEKGVRSVLRMQHANGLIATSSVLRELFDHGIHSLYIEGGSTTTSAFLAEGNIDVLQLHISPMIIGPGINSFSRPGVHSVTESVRFQRHLYQSVGDGVMLARKKPT